MTDKPEEITQAVAKVKPKRRRLIIPLALLALILLALFIWLRPLLPAAWSYLTLKLSPKREYDPKACLDNLNELSTALRLYLESEGAYPPAEEWMDRLSIYLRSADLDKADQQKKLRCPDLRSAPDAYGYAYNADLAGKAANEVLNKERTPVIYDSNQTARNAYDLAPFASLPKTPRQGGNNVLWADGHASPATSGG